MAISLKDLQKGTSENPPRILVFGVSGIGKTTLCSEAPNPIFIQTEDGLGMIQSDAFPLAKSYEEVREALGSLINDEHDYKTLVMDSLDWLEPLIQQEVCRQQGVDSIESIPYGKGFIMAMDIWRDYLTGLNTLRDTRGMMIIQTAHSDIKRFESPEIDSYDRYVIKLHAKAAAIVQEHSDCVFFTNYKTHVVQEDVGFNQKRNRAIGAGARMVYTQEKPSFTSKNRYGLPAEISLDDNTWSVLASNIPWFKQFAEAKPEPKIEAKAAKKEDVAAEPVASNAPRPPKQKTA